MSSCNGFDGEKYIKMQSERIKERISKFGDKLYLEVNCSTISMRRAYFLDSNQIQRSVCFVL